MEVDVTPLMLIETQQRTTTTLRRCDSGGNTVPLPTIPAMSVALRLEQREGKPHHTSSTFSDIYDVSDRVALMSYIQRESRSMLPKSSA